MIRVAEISNKNNLIPFRGTPQKSIDELSNDDLAKISSVPDEYVTAAVRHDQIQKFNNAPVRKVEKATSKAIPVADTLLTAALTPGSFGDKVFAGIGRAMEWGIFIKVTDNISKKLANNEKFRNFAQEHPAMATVASSIGVSAVGILAYTAIMLGGKKLLSKIKPAKEIIDAVHSDLDASKTGQKIAKELNSPKAIKFLNRVAIAGLIGLGLLVANKIVGLVRMKKAEHREEAKIKQTQLDAARELNTRLLDEKAQSQKPEASTEIIEAD